MFTGASQFALVGVVAAGGAPLSGAATALLLGTRNTLYGLRMAPLLQWRGWRRVGRRARAHRRVHRHGRQPRLHRGAPGSGSPRPGVAVFVLWNPATAIGAFAGEAVGDPRTFGLDAAVGAAFLALLWPRLEDRRNILVAVLGAAVALSMVPVTAPGVPVLAAGGVAVLVGVLSRRDDPTEVPGRTTWRAVTADVDRDPAGLRRLLRAQARRALAAGAGARATRRSSAWPT